MEYLFIVLLSLVTTHAWIKIEWKLLKKSLTLLFLKKKIKNSNYKNKKQKKKLENW
jgi:hypothetical protein